MADKVTWFELPVDDTSRAGKFYREVFGWETPDMGMGDGSLLAQTAPTGEDMQPLEKGTINGSIAPRSKTFDKPHIVVTVNDLDTKIKKIEEAGGSVVQPRQEIDGMMAFAIVSDTEGNNIGVIQNL
ncbi:MAG: VOC family protein [Candidatus Saccharimonas sp.]|nr:VOC family protein [Candidatus Saccharimonas sp.]